MPKLWDAGDSQYWALIASIMSNPANVIQDNSLFSIEQQRFCTVCARPVESLATECTECLRNRAHFPTEIADLVVPLTYGMKGTQAYTDLREYKETPASVPGYHRLAILTYFFVKYHGSCIATTSGTPVTHVTTVPSSKGRDIHALESIRLGYFSWLPFAPAAYVGPARTERLIVPRPEDFAFSQILTGAHILVFEDSWVRGTNAQSVAVAARRAGAARTTIVSMGRVIDPYYGINPNWLKTAAAKAPYNPLWCPVGRGPCPVGPIIQLQFP